MRPSPLRVHADAPHPRALPGQRLFLPDPRTYLNYGRRADDRVFLVCEGGPGGRPAIEVGARLGDALSA